MQTSNAPRDLFAHLRRDASAGVVVFLVALPLCLGIALASGAPLSSGIVSGIIAGVIVSWLSGSELSVSGPAAGLTLIVADAITRLGSFEAFLCAVVVAGVIQIALSFARAGAVGSIFPTCVIKGMVAAIGVILILKQVPHALGRDVDFIGDEAFWQFMDHENTFSELLQAFSSYTPGAAWIGLASLAVLIFWETLTSRQGKLASLVPAALAAVGIGVALNALFTHFAPSLALAPGSQHMVNLPTGIENGSFFSEVRWPNLAAFGDRQVYFTGILIAFLVSIESLLCLEATDRLDPYKRFSQPNRELLAQGVGNILCGFCGGLPITSVILRSSANIYAGGKTRLSSFIHGVLLLLCVLLFPKWLNHIPLASLAAVLIVLGYRLTRVAIFKKMYQAGPDQFVPFVVTLVAIVMTNLLTGVVIGLAVGFALIVKASYYSAITLVTDGKDYLLRFAKDVSFVSKGEIKRILASLPDNTRIRIDGSRAMFIDHDVYEVIENFRESAVHRGISVELHNMESKPFELFKKRTA